MGSPLLHSPEATGTGEKPANFQGTSEDSIKISGLRVTPPGNPGLALFDNFNFTVNPGEDTAIVGPSGSGKSSLLRVLAGLWTPAAGDVQAPASRGRGGLLFIPQRSYTTMGTLREQVVYPGAYGESGEEEIVVSLLAAVGLSSLLAEWF